MNGKRQMADERLQTPPQTPAFAVIKPALKVGAACGGLGFLVGGTSGIINGTAPFLFATASAIPCFLLGTTFWGCRSTILQSWVPNHRTPGDLVKASAFSGGVAGAVVAGLTRGRSNILPGIVMMSLFGCLGQVASNKFSARREVDTEPQKGFWMRMSEKSFSPVTVLTNEQYADMLREKMLKVEVEISIIDDKIAALKEQRLKEAAMMSTSKVTEK